MAIKLTAAVIFLGVSLFNFPVYAESLDASPPPAAVKATESAPDLDLKVPQQSKSEEDMNRMNLRYYKGYFVDAGKIVSSPLRWDTGDWLKLGAVVGATSSLFLVDDEINDFAQKNQNSVASKFASVGNFIGDPTYAAAGLGSFYLYGHLADDSQARRASMLALESAFIAGIATSAIKLVASRHRPEDGDGSGMWHGPSLSTKWMSFSSGHTSTAFSIATVLAEEYKDNKYVPPIAYSLATLTGLSRIYSNEHWASDTLFGAALGYFTAKAVLSFHKKDNTKWANRISVMPAVGSQMTGLTVKYDF